MWRTREPAVAAAAGNHHSGRCWNSFSARSRASRSSGESSISSVPAEHDDGLPVILVGDVVNFQADARVLAHPGDLLADAGEAVDAASIRIE